MNSKFLLISFSAIIIFYSCDKLTYAPKGENVVHVNQPTINENKIQIDLDNFSDTLFIWGSTIINLTLDTDDKIFSHIQIYIDSVNIGSISSTVNLNFRLESTRFPNGNHILHFKIVLQSGSGSLAENYGAEYFEIHRQFPLQIDNSYPDPIAITSVGLEDGTIRIKWPKYTKKNFQFYKISRNYYLEQYIYDVNQNYYDDTTYCAGRKTLQYIVDIYAADRWAYGNPYQYEFDHQPQLVMDSLDNLNRPILKWEQCIFYRNFQSYSIESTNGVGITNWWTAEEKTNANDTTFVGKPLKFGTEYHFKVLINGYENDYQIGNYIPIHSGSKSFPFARLKYVPELNSIYLNPTYYFGIMLDVEFLRLDADSLSLQNQSPFPTNDFTYAIASDGTKLFAHEKFQKHQIHELDPITLQPIQVLPIINLFGPNDHATAHSIEYLPSDRIILKIWNSLYDNYVIWNYITDDTTHNTFPHGTYPVSIEKCSDTGNYILIAHDNLYTLYEISSNRFLPLTDIQNERKFCFGFRNDQYVLTENNKISVRECFDNSIIFEHNIDDDLLYPSIDPTHNSIGGYVSSEWYSGLYRIYDLNTGVMLLEIPVTSSHLAIVNSFILSRSGYFMPLDY